MNLFFSQLLPIFYGACFLLLLWQAFRVMGQGFKAVPRPGDGNASTSLPTPPHSGSDRTGRVTIHPELLDDDGQLTNEDLLTVRFSGDNERPAWPGDPS